MKAKTSELIGAALDWAVEAAMHNWDSKQSLHYSADWAQCGALIDELKMEVRHYSKALKAFQFGARRNRDGFAPTSCRGPTYQVAICRCYVLAKIGQFVNLPKELT